MNRIEEFTNRILAGYSRREDGTYAHRIEFMGSHDGRSRGFETLVRNKDGRLLRVERSARARTKRMQA